MGNTDTADESIWTDISLWFHAYEIQIQPQKKSLSASMYSAQIKSLKPSEQII